jgi:superfamily I DNA/RNA helicase
VAIRHLINEDGTPFSEGDLGALSKALDALTGEERTNYRNENASAIAEHGAKRMLIVAGPGTGKSSIFKQRVLAWLRKNPDARILALSFVRKLVADLNGDIQNDKALTDDQKAQCDVFTLHKYARSVVEQNNGSKRWPFAPHFRIIGQRWKAVVWHDVLLLSGKDSGRYTWKAFEKQMHNDQFDESADWRALATEYYTLCELYNAAGFSDLILRAKIALSENPTLNEHQHYIIDEYQDFNTAEESLLQEMTKAAHGSLIVGDDDQVLYEGLKSGKASLIRAVYADSGVVNATLAFCNRCDFHITRTASHFIKQAPDPDSIRKIYLPMTEADACAKVQILGCVTAATAVDYIRKFIEDNKGHIEKRKEELASGESKDAYLLILSPSGAVNFYSPNGARDELFEIIKPYTERASRFSEDYYRLLTYYSLAHYPANNFTFRKVLHYENTSDAELLDLLKMCTDKKKALSSSNKQCVRNASAKATAVRDILNIADPVEEKIKALAKHIQIASTDNLRQDLEKIGMGKGQVDALEHREEEDAELEEIGAKPMGAVELMTIVGAKGLSADHVIIIGFDDVNMGWVTRNAFFVALTRARKSLHLITALKAGGATRAHDFLGRLPDANLEFSKYTKGGRRQDKYAGRRNWMDYVAFLSQQGRPR